MNNTLKLAVAVPGYVGLVPGTVLHSLASGVIVSCIGLLWTLYGQAVFEYHTVDKKQ